MDHLLDETAVRILMGGDEGLVEFKEKIPDSKLIADYSVGIGNEGGGWLIAGITDKAPRRICGIPRQCSEELQRLRNSVFDQTSIRVEPHAITTADGDILAVRIPGRRKGQVFCTKSGKYLTRSGSTLRGMTPDEIASILAEAAPGDDPLQKRIDEAQLLFFILRGVPQWYILQAENQSSEEILIQQITLKKDEVELAPPARLGLLLLPGRGGPVGWKPNSDPITKLELLCPPPAHVNYAPSFATTIDVILQCDILGRRTVFSNRVLIEASALHRSIRQL